MTIISNSESALYSVDLLPYLDVKNTDVSWTSKIIDYPRAPDLLRQFFAEVGWILITGCWDNPSDDLHPGHRSLLTTMKRKYDMHTVVGVESDQTVYENKGFLRPFRNADSRAENVARLPEVDYVIILPQTIRYGAPDHSSKRIVTERVESLSPTHIMIDAEDPTNPYPFSHNRLAKEFGITRLVFTRIGNFSTSSIRGY